MKASTRAEKLKSASTAWTETFGEWRCPAGGFQAASVQLHLPGAARWHGDVLVEDHGVPSGLS